MPITKKAVPNELSSQFEEMGQSMSTRATHKTSGLGKIIMVVVIVLVILGGLFMVSKYTAWNIFGLNKTTTVNASGWQAVFLTNGQVYFGRINKTNSENLVLNEIYYLQVTQTQNSQQIQPADQQGANQQPATQPNVSLVKLGNELHGPKDAMTINRAHVLFTEELKEDSRVVDAIKRYVEDSAKK